MRMQLKTAAWMLTPVILILSAAYIQWGTVGLPALAPIQKFTPQTAKSPFGFPLWLIVTHYINFILLVYLVRSGLQILADHPRLYWNVHCTPDSEWLRLTPVKVPRDRIWTAKDDSRHLSPVIGLPGYRHTIGMARHWHFLSVLFWVVNGAAFIILLFVTDQWKRLVPGSWDIIPGAWAWFVHYATFHLPAEPDGFYYYNPLQKLAYFGVVFILAPLAIISGPSMSPAFTARFKWYPKLPGNRQIGRSLHFLMMCAFVLFTIAHVIMVGITGLLRNMNHITRGTDGPDPLGLYMGLGAIAFVVLLNVLANWAAWRHPRTIQRISKAIVTPVMHRLLGRQAAVAEFRREDISPFFWPNGKMPDSDEWKTLAVNDFKDYRLKVHGLVDNPVELSIDDLRALTCQSQITLHHCIQGWSGIAEWSGLPLKDLIRLVRPKPEAQRIVFHSFGDGVEFTTGESNGRYYDSLSMANAQHPQTLLAYEMNGKPLNHLHGAPLRLRIENQLGFKMVKWIDSIQFVSSSSEVGLGEGGYAEDYEYFGEQANI